MPRQRTGNWSHTTWIQLIFVLAALLLVARAASGTDEKDPNYLTVFRAEARIVEPVEPARCGTIELDLEVVSSEDRDCAFPYDSECVYPYEVLDIRGDVPRTVAVGELYRNDDDEIVGTAAWQIELEDAGDAWAGEVRVDAFLKDEEGNVVHLETLHPLAIAIPEDACEKDDAPDSDTSGPPPKPEV